MTEFGEIEDGFGSVWAKCKADCQIHVVRPGKSACYPCDEMADQEFLREELANGACPQCSRPWAVQYHGGSACEHWLSNSSQTAKDFLDR